MHPALFIPSAVLLASVATLAFAATAIDLPPVKSGMWETKTTPASGSREIVTQMCLDAAIQKEMLQMGTGLTKSLCTRNDLRRDGSKIYGTAECKIGESKMQSKSVMTFAGDSAYHTEISANYDPPFMGKTTTSTTVDGKWTGPCPADMQPGDVLLPDGKKINMRSVMGGGK
jgi:Protein of unknown function (DUF3617)